MQKPGLLSRKIQITALSLMLASSIALAKKDEYITPLAVDALTFEEVNKTYKLVDMKKAFKEKNRIIIGNYRVGYTVAKSSYAKEKGGSQVENIGSNGWKTVRTFKDKELRSTVQLEGLETADLNKITEKAYQDLIKRLQDTGREVVTMDKIADSPAIAEELKLNKLQENGEYWTNIGIGEARELIVVTWPQVTPLWFLMGDVLDVGGSLKAAGNALKQKNFGFVKAISAEQDAAILDVSVKIQFANAWSKKKQMGVDPNMTMKIAKVTLLSSKKSRIGIFPGPSGSMDYFKKAEGFDLGTGYGDYSKDVTVKEDWSVKGKTLEVTVTTTPERMEEAVLNGLLSLNAAIAAVAAEYPAK